MKKLINAPEDVLVESLRGVAAAHPELSVDLENHVITRATPKAQGKVAVVSGGGSGHEPLHGGYVGTGMLDAAVAGEVFTSPTPDRVQVATQAVDRGAGVLHIVKNYTGDVLNFEMAAELAEMEGIEVDTVNTPKTAQNFIDYVQSGHYDGTIFHRVIDGFMIQGGGFASGMKQKETKAPIENEAKQGVAAGLKNVKGTLAMARTSDPHSASAQFFINVGDNDFLDYPGQDGWGYAVFGKVVEGMDVVEKIKGVPTGTSGFHRDVPVQDVVIERAEIV